MSRPPTTGLFDDPCGEQGELPDPVDPLDVRQPFADATSYEVRGELQRLIERDLLGPWDDEKERFPPGARGPRDRYLIGMLGSKPALTSARESADRVPATEPGVSGDGEPDLPEIVTPQNLGRMWASSGAGACSVTRCTPSSPSPATPPPRPAVRRGPPGRAAALW